MSDARIVVEKDANVGWIRLNRPERLNAFAGTMRTDLLEALRELDHDVEIRCVIITGVGRAFSTGGDITVMSAIIEENDRARFEQLVRTGAEVVRQIDSMSKPVIAAINGAAAGAGACLTLACDLRIASETASIGFTFLRVGLHPDWGGSYFLPRLVGPAVAAEFIYTGGMISAERGERLGLFNRVVPAAQLESAARGFAGEISASPVGVIADAKRALRTSLSSTLTQVLEMEIAAQLRAFDTPDFSEGINAFVAKRSPRFNRPRPGDQTAGDQPHDDQSGRDTSDVRGGT